MPRSVTAVPSARAPVAKAADSSTPEARMSRPTRRRGAPVKRATAPPIARHNVASICSGTVPRMSYALKTPAVAPMGRSAYLCACPAPLEGAEGPRGRQREQGSDAGERQGVTCLCHARGAVGELHVVAGRQDHHQVRRGPPWTERPLDVPVREVGDLHENG